MAGTSTRKVRVAFNAKPLYFMGSALRHEFPGLPQRRSPFPQLPSERRKNIDKSG
jgi:hypothetical protein